MRQVFLIVAFVLLCALLTVLEPRFLTVYNWLNIFEQAATIGIVSAGVTMLMIGGGFDLSVGSVVVLASAIVAIAFGNGMATPLAVFLAVLGGAVIGCINGLGIAYLKIPSMIMTLGMLYLVRGGILALSGGQTLGRGFPDSFTFLGKGGVGPVPMPAIIMVAVYLVLQIVLKKTSFGRYTIAVGTNAETTWRVGIRARWHLSKLYILSGALAGLAGLVIAARLDSSSLLVGQGYELEAIAAVVIGGTSLFGGRGALPGTLVGVLFLAVVHNGLNLLGVSPYLATFAIGALLLFSATIDVAATLARRR